MYRGSAKGDYIVWDVWNSREEDAYRIELPSEEAKEFQTEVAMEAAEQAAEMMFPDQFKRYAVRRSSALSSNDESWVEVCVKNLKTGQRWTTRVNAVMIFSSIWVEPVGADEIPEDAVYRQHREETERNLQRLEQSKKDPL